MLLTSVQEPQRGAGALLGVQTASSCAAGLTSACLTNPFDVIKTRLQVAFPEQLWLDTPLPHKRLSRHQDLIAGSPPRAAAMVEIECLALSVHSAHVGVGAL